ncbi:Unknown protein, partial [Striga hermonthica]
GVVVFPRDLGFSPGREMYFPKSRVIHISRSPEGRHGAREQRIVSEHPWKAPCDATLCGEELCHSAGQCDANTARRLKNAASRPWHARRRLSDRAGEARYVDGHARAGDDARDTVGDEIGVERADDGVHARACLGAQGLGELLDACAGMEHEAL